MKKIIFFGIIAGLFTCAWFMLFPLHKALLISETKTGKILRSFPVKNSDEFIISFVHSINKRPVSDYIKIDGDDLLIYKSRYDAFGAGMPETSIDGGIQLTLLKNSVIELTNIDRRMPELAIFVGRVANHMLIIKDVEIPLNQIAQAGTSLTFKIGKASYYNIDKK